MCFLVLCSVALQAQPQTRQQTQPQQQLQSQQCGQAVRLYDSAKLCAIPLYTEKIIRRDRVPVEAVIRLRVRKVPDDWAAYLSQFPNLQELHLSHLRLQAVPDVVFQLPLLSVLDLSNNRIRYMPPELGNLVLLRELHLNRNPLAYLPQSISQLESLEILDAWSTNIAELPAEIRNLRGTLKTVNLLAITLSDAQKEAMQQLRPQTEFLFSASCGCGR